MNMIKKNGGFTLVELIVVIAILAILAGVAVPAYSGYLNKANAVADDVALDTASNAIVAATSMNGVDTADVTIDWASSLLTVTHDDSTLQGKIQGDLATFMNVDSYDSGIALAMSYYDDVEWNGSILVGIVTDVPAGDGE